MHHVIGYIKTHGLLVFIITLGVASSVIGVGIILSANTNTVHDTLDESQAVAQNDRSSLEQCLAMISITESVEQYKQQLACYESYAPNDPEKNNLQNKINEMEVSESTDSGQNDSEAQNENVYVGDTANSSPEQVINQVAQTAGTSTDEVVAKITSEQEKMAQCETYKQQYGNKTPEELAQEDLEILEVKKELELVVLDLNRGHPDWVSDPKEKEYWKEYNIQAEKRFQEVQARARELMRKKIDYYAQLGDACR